MLSPSPRCCKPQAIVPSCQENGTWEPMTLPNTGLKNTLAHWQVPRHIGTPSTSSENLKVARYAIIKKESFMGQMQSLIMRLTFFRKGVKHQINLGFYTLLIIPLTFLCRHPSLQLRNMLKPIK